MSKLTLTPPNSSNRLEINHFQPLIKGDKSLSFFDNTVYAKAQPSDSWSDSNGFVKQWGNSIRFGYRKLSSDLSSYHGFNGGYDVAWFGNSFFQQIGVGGELIRPSYNLVATASFPLGNGGAQASGQSAVSSANLQIGFPLGIPGFSGAARAYYLFGEVPNPSPGAQLQIGYGFNHNLSATLSGSFDDISGFGSSLQFKFLFRPPSPASIPAGMPYSTAVPYSQALGNTGSRIIRLSGSTPAYGN
ncbi:hypothetical protein [Cyanobium sp. WAJ14-Wanaka]|uniref:hypothetical protein n=1 Tax=Cyanobium sp. WAJ14-Wanaka TaxID=2823725 RepID=UPI0020CBB9E5|nr:hypothetical protein [Cyanobium sp. WAJ14-Wanaka]MCP9775035.1 hypothetical protein [Cyanobium sp. WAJ14-Wanaka]